MNILKNFVEPPEVKQNKKLIEQTKSKKEQLIKSIDVDINNINMKINSMFQDIGNMIYNNYIKSGDILVEKSMIQDSLDSIQSQKLELEVLNQKRQEIEQRYGEEIEMLIKLLPQENENNLKTNSYLKSCQKCGNRRLEEDLFCTNCGNRY